MWKAMVAGLMSMTALVPPALAQERVMDRGDWRRPGAERPEPSPPPRDALGQPDMRGARPAPQPDGPGRDGPGRDGPPRRDGQNQWNPTVPQPDGPGRRGPDARERMDAPIPPDSARRWDGRRDDPRRWDGVRRPGGPDGAWRSDRGDPRRRFDGVDRPPPPPRPDGWHSERDPRWDRDWRRESRYDWQRYRDERRSLFRLPRYYAPYGWDGGYRRFGIGAPLAPMLYTPRYWIYDPYAYRLPSAEEPYRWVRYYGDALLVDIEDGTIVDVIHGIFQ